MMSPEIPDDVISAIQFVYTYAANETDWLKIKKEILKSVKPSTRTLFSKRHPITKKQLINQFDITVAAYWERMSGKSLALERDGRFEKNTS